MPCALPTRAGKVVRGPAPLSLALAHVNEQEGKVVLSPWTETDFRTGEAPWQVPHVAQNLIEA
jgi:hypothetical protein